MSNNTNIHKNKMSDLLDGTAEKMQLGYRMKSLEKTEIILPYQSFVVRVDGNCFSRFTSGFRKPFDPAFQKAMIRTANSLLVRYNPTLVFVCSDEISLVFRNQCDRKEYDRLIESNETNIPQHMFS